MKDTHSALDLPLRPTTGNSKWFTEARFGMFIHWGLYALPARHEWVKNMERLTTEQYQRYFDHFDPDLYDPELWADAAANAGMKYFVVTTKHHDGFCLWDSALTDYKITNTPYGKDAIEPMVQAFEARGLQTGLYHSLIDWRHPHFKIDEMHPLRDHPDRKALNVGSEPARYTEYLHGQVRELLVRFPKLRLIFFDFSYPSSPGRLNSHGEPWEGKGHLDWGSEELVQMIRELRPDILLDDRLDLPDQASAWEYTTPEQYQPEGWKTVNGERVVWEACQTFSGSWGYYRDEESWKSVKQLILMLIDTVAKGGNLLLNVGPTGRGEFDERALDRLKGMGEWMRRHNRSIYGCSMAPFEAPQDCRYTYNSTTNRLYLHVLSWPTGTIRLEGLNDRLEYAQLLNDASEVPFIRGGEHESFSGITLKLPVKSPNVSIPVIELYLTGDKG